MVSGTGHGLRAALAVAQRAIAGKARHPLSIVADLAAPLLLIAVFSAAFSETVDLAGFPPVRSFLDFGLVGTVFIGVFFTASDVGESVALDVEHGFFDRLLVSPVPRSAILVGVLGSAAAVALVESLFYMAVLAAFGVRFAGGLWAVAAVAAVVTVLGTAMAAFTTRVGLSSGTAGAFGAFVPISLVVTFVSSVFAPRALMTGWFRALAGANPVSWLVEDLRHQVITGFEPWRVLQALAMVTLVAVPSIWAAAVALRTRADGR